MRRLLPGAVLALLAGCGVVIPRPDAAMAARVSASGTGADLPTLERGYAIFIARCNGCHALPAPASEPRDRWPDLVAHMMKRARLQPGEGADVLAYLQAAAGP